MKIICHTAKQKLLQPGFDMNKLCDGNGDFSALDRELRTKEPNISELGFEFTEDAIVIIINADTTDLDITLYCESVEVV